MPTPRLLIATTGTAGDIVPFVLLAQELSKRGHRVTMLVPAFHAAFMRSQPFSYEVMGTVGEFHAVLDDPLLWHERKGFGVIWQALVPHLDVLRELVARQPVDAPCVLLCHPLLVPLADIARATRPDLRIVCAYLAPSNLCSSHDLLTMGSQRMPSWLPLSWRHALWRMVYRFWIDPAILPSLNACRMANKLPAVSGFFDHMHRVADVSLSLFPPWFASIQPDWPAPFVTNAFPSAAPAPGAALAPQLAAFLSAAEAPIAFTPGTGHRHARDYFVTALKVLARLKRRGLFVTPYRDQLPAALPPGVMWVEQAPFSLLLPRLAALVHHGGIGTMAEAFRAGIPQLIVPYAFDQFDNGLRAKNLGVAEVVLARRMSARRLHRRLLHLLSSPQVAQACAALAVQAAPGASLSSLGATVEQALGLQAGPTAHSAIMAAPT